jgi:hypothetical protein
VEPWKRRAPSVFEEEEEEEEKKKDATNLACFEPSQAITT